MFPSDSCISLATFRRGINHIEMEGASNPSLASELHAAKAAVAATLQDADTLALFGQPVDPRLLPDYLDIIKQPKDLGSIVNDLDASLQGSGPYKTARDVLDDVHVVWANCLQYNNRPEDKPIVDICRRSSKIFNKEWRKAGLPTVNNGKRSMRTLGEGTKTARRSPEPPVGTRMVDDYTSNGENERFAIAVDVRAALMLIY